MFVLLLERLMREGMVISLRCPKCKAKRAFYLDEIGGILYVDCFECDSQYEARIEFVAQKDSRRSKKDAKNERRVVEGGQAIAE